MPRKPKFTPGPWNAERHGNSIVGIQAQAAQDDIAQVVQPGGREEQTVNAALIAQAPAMFDLLETAYSDYAEFAARLPRGQERSILLAQAGNIKAVLDAVAPYNQPKEKR